MASIFLDTNVLLYSISTAQTERAKRVRALEMLDADDVALSVQVLQEFYVQATRPSRPDKLPHETAVGLIAAWTRFRIQAVNLRVMTAA
ncbi:MAG TPA: PIN domain-containing protein, partial [Stellaceae bacterium]|nr:PIN domain-containing protein [Stellaceae bacterium]